MGFKRHQSVRRQYKFYSKDKADYARQYRNIELLFTWFAVLAVVDLGADLNMLVSITRSYQKFDGVKSDSLQDCASTCSETGPCFANAPCNETLCQSFSRWAAENTENSCRVDQYTTGVNSVNGSVIADGCGMLGRTEGYDDSLTSLKEIQLSYGAFVVVSIILTLYYLYCLYGKFKARVSLIPEVVADVRIGKIRDKLDKPYFAPPVEDFPGRPAAPYYHPEESAAKVEKKVSPEAETTQSARGAPVGPVAVFPSCAGCQIRDEAREIYCRVCGSAFDDNGSAGVARHRQQEIATAGLESSRRHLYRQYLQTFVSTAGVRFLALTLEDMPQAILIIMYVVAIDKPDGLNCMECSVDGRLCDFGTSYPKFAVYLVLLGQLGSVTLLCIQVLYLKGLENKERKQAYSQYDPDRRRADFTWCGVDTLLLFIMIPAFIAPILITILVTDMQLILHIGAGSSWFIALVVLAVVFSLPWLAATLLTGVVCADQCGLDDCECCCECCEGCVECATCCCG